MIEEVAIQEQEPQQPDPPKKKLWRKLNSGNLYTKSYEDFEQQFNTPERIGKLYQSLSEKKLYTKTPQEFNQQFFQDAATPKKKVGTIGFEESSLQAGNVLSQSGGVDGEEIPTIEMYTTPSGEMVEANPISLSKKYRELSNRKKVGDTIIGSGLTMGTTGTPVPDEEAQKSAKKLKEDFPNIDFEGISEEIKDIPDEVLQRVGKELMADREQNNPLYQRKLANIKWRKGLEDNLLEQVDKGNIDPDNYNRIKESIDNLPVFTGTGDFTNQRGAIKSLAQDIQLYGGENKDKILENFAIEVSKVYGSAYKNNFDKYAADTPESKYLNNDAQLGLQYLEDVAPEKAKQYERLKVDPKNLEGDALKGYNHLMQTIEETGIGLQQNAVTEELNDLKNKANNRQLTDEEIQKATDLEKKQEELTQKRNELDVKYPDRIEDKVDDAMQEILGQKIGGLNYFGGTAFRSIKNTGQGIWEAVSTPFMSDASNTLRELSIMGEGLEQNRIYHKTEKNTALLTDTMVMQPELQKQVDAITNNKVMTESEKEMKLYRLLKDNTDKFGRVPIKGGKFNINPSSIMYGLSDLGTTLLPFIALETVTGGGATAGLARKFVSTFTAAAATTFHAEYEAALLSGRTQSEAYKEAMGMTAISSLAMAGAGTPAKIKAMVNPKTSAGQLILSMSDDAIQKVLGKGVPKGLKAIGQNLKERAKAVPKQLGGGAKTGAEFEVAMTAANEAKHQIYDTEIDREANFKHSLLMIGNFSGLGLMGQARFKTPTQMQKGAGLMFGAKPKEYIAVAEQMKKDGQLNEAEFNQRVELINQFGDAYKSVPKDLPENKKAEYLYQTVIKNEANKGKSDLPPKQAAEAEKTALVADHTRGLILESPTDKQLTDRKTQLEKKLEPKKDAEGKAIEIPEKEKLNYEAELEAINNELENRKSAPKEQPKGTPEEITKPIELSTETPKEQSGKDVVVDEGMKLDYNDKGEHLAPNGKPSKLSELQAKITKSKAFKNWFGDSKVVDENGEPLIVYHGTKNDFTEFKHSKDIGYHFGSKSQAEYRSSGGKMLPFFLNAKNIIEVSDVFTENGWLQLGTELVKKGVLTEKEINNIYDNNIGARMFEAIKDKLLEKGIDGLSYINQVENRGLGDKSYVIFEKNKAKIADGRNVTFDSKSNDFVEQSLSTQKSKPLDEGVVDKTEVKGSGKGGEVDWNGRDIIEVNGIRAIRNDRGKLERVQDDIADNMSKTDKEAEGYILEASDKSYEDLDKYVKEYEKLLPNYEDWAKNGVDAEMNSASVKELYADAATAVKKALPTLRKMLSEKKIENDIWEKKYELERTVEKAEIKRESIDAAKKESSKRFNKADAKQKAAMLKDVQQYIERSSDINDLTAAKEFLSENKLLPELVKKATEQINKIVLEGKNAEKELSKLKSEQSKPEIKNEEAKVTNDTKSTEVKGDVDIIPDKTGSKTEAGEGKKEPPKEPTDTVGEGKGTKELDKLANNVPDSGKITEYMSKDTIEKYTGETPTNDQSRGIQELDIALNHGEKIIEKAQELYGKDYAEKTLDYIDNSTAGVSNKALMYVSLENALGREKLLNPDKAAEITKQQALVYAKSQAFARENSLALNYQKLRKIAQVGYDINKVTDSFFSAEELVAKKDIEKAIEADADTINKEAERQETGGITPDVEKQINEGVAKEIEKIYQKLPKEKKTAVDKAISALENVQAKLRSKTYDATLGIPVAVIDAGITTIKLALKAGVKIADAIELGINKIKDKYGKQLEKSREDEIRKDLTAAFSKIKTTKDIVKEKLIENGFGREVTIKGEKKKILDWKKLAGAAGTVSKISENVGDALLGDKKYTAKDIEAIKNELIKEYIDLRTSVIEKAQNELATRNKETVTADQKSAAKKLSELYTYGLFEKNPTEFETTLNKALGAKVSESGYKEAKAIAKGLETIFSSSFKGVKLSDVSAKAAIEKLEDQMRILLFKESKAQGNNNLKWANMVRGYFDIQQTMILNNLKQAVENPLSGLQQNLIDKILVNAQGTSTGELANQRRNLMKSVYADMMVNGGIGYGKIENVFVNRRHIDDYVNKLSDNKLYRGIASVVTGKATLNTMDAMWKASITEKKFTSNLIKILTHETNKNRMGKEDAVKFVSEKLTGQTFKDAQATAKTIIEQINKDAKTELISPNENQVNRFANDIVKASLEMGGKITPEQITAAYNAAYKSAGLGLGHTPNNFLSTMITDFSAKTEGAINQAIKNKEWNRAAMLTYKSILFRNVLNPFVGGGTNWLVLKFEKTGLGLFTGLGYQIGSKGKIDVGTELGMKRLEERLYNQARVKDNYMRGLVGGITSMLAYATFLSIADEDKYRKWRSENRWAARVLDTITPEYLLAEMAIKDKKVKQYVSTSLNKNDAFDASTKLIKAAEYAAKGDKGKAWGALGETIGSKINFPLPWRLVKDGQVIYQGVIGQDPYHGNYKPSEGFWSGAFQGGAIEWLGGRPISKPKPPEMIEKYLKKDGTELTDKDLKDFEDAKQELIDKNIETLKEKGIGDTPYKDLTPEEIKEEETYIKGRADDEVKAQMFMEKIPEEKEIEKQVKKDISRGTNYDFTLPKKQQ